jgi:hypothetical protein
MLPHSGQSSQLFIDADPGSAQFRPNLVGAVVCQQGPRDSKSPLRGRGFAWIYTLSAEIFLNRVMVFAPIIELATVSGEHRALSPALFGSKEKLFQLRCQVCDQA